MINPQQLFASIQEHMNQVLPDASKMAQEDLAAQLKIVVGSVVSKLDLVSRDEFDAQQAVLERTRSKLEQLEKDVADLEARLADKKV